MEIKIEYPLNKQTIEELFKESEKRGFVKGNIFKDVHNGKKWEIDEIMFYHNSQDLRNVKGGCVWCNGKWAEIISYKEGQIDGGSCINDFKTPKHYDNSKGSIYQFCENQKLNSYEFEVIKRISRCRKKGNFKEDLEKTKHLIDLYLKEYEEIKN